MNATGSDVRSPFVEVVDSDVAAAHRPWIDDEVMRRLRTPFEADPVDVLDRQGAVVFDEHDHRG
jgi:hypothetical protein